jgi:vacuolar-type H+-ATPase subunit D/Vma8
MGYGRMKKKKEELKKEIDELLKNAEAVDKEEDKKIRKRQEGLGLARRTQKM